MIVCTGLTCCATTSDPQEDRWILVYGMGWLCPRCVWQDEFTDAG
jgi:hypothetical protein